MGRNRRVIALLVILGAAFCFGCTRPPQPPVPPRPSDFALLLQLACPQYAANPAKLADVVRMCNVPNRAEVILCVGLVCQGGVPPTPHATPTSTAIPTQTVGTPAQVPTVLSTVAPTVPPISACPALLWVDANRKGGTSRIPWDDGSLCWLIDMTPRFDVDGSGRGQPCNAEHPNCGAAGNASGRPGDACEPTPESLIVTYVSEVINATDNGYAGRICGSDGSSYSVSVTLQPGAVDKAGRLIPLPSGNTKFVVFTLPGTI